MVLCPGLTSTQAELHELAELLRCDHDVVTFDHRGHGRTSAAHRYSFEEFFGDFVGVLTELPRCGSFSAPVLVGHSLGADLIVHYASEFPDAVSELVLIDGANPLPEPFISEADLPEFLALWEGVAARQAAEGTERRVLLTAQEILDVNLELDVVRAGIFDRYPKIRCPISMIMSTSMAGTGDDERTVWRNRNWHAGVERLVGEWPHIATSWLDADHGLVVTHAPEIAEIIRDAPAAADDAAS